MDITTKNKIYGGIHRFCLRIKGVKHKNKFSDFKFGISTQPSDQKDSKSFSDYDTGFSFYSIGQTRNGSSDSGMLYQPGSAKIGNIY